MRKVKRVWSSLAIIFASVHSVPVLANWQFTSWGMTPDEVDVAATAAGKSLTRTARQFTGRTVYHEGTFSPGNVETTVSLYYERERLVEVELKGDRDSKCFVLDADLKERYGAPFSRTDLMVAVRTIWMDRDNGNRVSFTRMEDSCFLNYQAIGGASNSQL